MRVGGHKVEILHADKDYLDCFYHTVSRSKTPEHNGKFYGFPIGGMCSLNREVKTAPISKYLKQFPNGEVIQYVGIAIDEPKRLKNLEKRGQISLLEKYDYTEQMCFDLCKEYGLLSPIYEHCKRGGCWFCPNNSCKLFAHIKLSYPELWAELDQLSHTTNLVSQNFRYVKTFAEVDCEVDRIISEWELEKSQIRLF